ncbi:hypothetical protein B0J13DRAFT_45362 [Dactylonectria estremocensis]|uniref:Uncharacterized protein n=1 Tax=Dactylonectria estremocensis TaxID=1079267 RepID=A0A9P9EU44_9HYPO|nr:hypothetical protein B0J13DRAFT_45362 [Dactylonectria estremocensis]
MYAADVVCVSVSALCVCVYLCVCVCVCVCVSVCAQSTPQPQSQPRRWMHIQTQMLIHDPTNPTQPPFPRHLPRCRSLAQCLPSFPGLEDERNCCDASSHLSENIRPPPSTPPLMNGIFPCSCRGVPTGACQYSPPCRGVRCLLGLLFLFFSPSVLTVQMGHVLRGEETQGVCKRMPLLPTADDLGCEYSYRKQKQKRRFSPAGVEQRAPPSARGEACSTSLPRPTRRAAALACPSSRCHVAVSCAAAANFKKPTCEGRPSTALERASGTCLARISAISTTL